MIEVESDASKPLYPILILLVQEKLSIFLSNEKPEHGIKCFSEQYSAVYGSGFIGIYDWLRSRSSRLLGVRLWPSEERELREIVSSLAQYAYVYVCPSNACVEIFFDAEREYDPAQSEAMDLWYSDIFVSSGNSVSLAFGTESLSVADLETLATKNVGGLVLP